MKHRIYKVFDGLVMAMMLAALLNVACAKSAGEFILTLGLFALGGMLLGLERWR